MPTATSFRFSPRASTSRASRRFRSAGMRTRTSLRSIAITLSDSKDVLSDCAELLANEENALHDCHPRCGGEQRDRAREGQLVEWDQHETGGDDDDTLGSAAEADVSPQSESLRPRARVANQEGSGDRGEGQTD